MKRNKIEYCTECNKDLKVDTKSQILSVYKTANTGPTLYQPEIGQCSKECYEIALNKRIDYVKKNMNNIK